MGTLRISSEGRRLLARLEAIETSILKQHSNNMLRPAVRAGHDALLGALDTRLGPGQRRAFLKEAEEQGVRDRLLRLNARLHYATEVAIAQRFLTGRSVHEPFAGSWINRGFYRLLHEMARRWKCRWPVSRWTRIVVVGGGALPQTQIVLSDLLDCAVDAVERDSRAVELSSAILRRIGRADLRVMLADGNSFDYREYSAVIVATLVRGKRHIAIQVATTSPSAILSIRTPTGLHVMWREAVNVAALRRLGWACAERWSPSGSTVGVAEFTRSAGCARR